MYIRKNELKDYINGKLIILRDFRIVNNRNEKEYYEILIKAVRESPEPYDVVLDRVTMKMIRDKLGD